MKVRVTYTEEVDDDFRRALASYQGSDGIASREDMKDYFKFHGTNPGMMDDIMWDYEHKDIEFDN